MKQSLLFVFILSGIASIAQPRLLLDTTLAPFYHGVASGDPLQDAVIIWTRITTQDTGNISVTWRMATDTLFTNVVKSGAATTGSYRDHTVKVDVTGLQPATHYYYQFEYNNLRSLTGRTKTAPVGNNNHLRFAVASCANYENGYFNAYEHIAYRNDIDAVIHLGDYIYEYEIGGLPGSDPNRTSDPPHEIITLADYRLRYSHYRLDQQLRQVHQQYPFITTWDDHETANNSWFGGAGNHTPGTEGDWFVRKANGKQAYFEWLPVRESPIDSFRLYRKFNYGNLADIIVLDTRLEGREEQDGTNNQSNTRTILGVDQYNWLVNNLKDTATQWKIVAQQVMMAPLGIGSITFNDDQWDGYPKERLKLYNEILNKNIKNFVVLTGDIHTSWANDLPGPNYNIFTGSGSVGVEFVTTSITTSNADLIGIPINPAIFFPHVKWANLTAHGYTIVDINQNRTQSDWVFVNTIDSPNPNASVSSSWYVNDTERNLKQASSAAPGLASVAPLAPWTVYNPPLATAKVEQEIIVLGSYPNPFRDNFIVQFYTSSGDEKIEFAMFDLSGKIVIQQEFLPATGINYFQINASYLPAGQYLLVMKKGAHSFQRNIIKVN